MSTLKVDTILKRTGTGTITVGQSGDTISVPTGATLSVAGSTVTAADMGPSFFAYLSSDQSLSADTETKVVCDTEIYDSDSKYDASSGRFTPGVVGKYFIFGSANIFQDDSSDLKIAQILWYKNGSKLYETHDNYASNYLRGTSQSMSIILDMDADDYVEMYAEIQINSGANNLRVESANRRTVFGAYRIFGV